MSSPYTDVTLYYWSAPYPYEIHILGQCRHFQVMSVSGGRVHSVDAIDSLSLASLAWSFDSCIGLQSVPSDIRAPNVTDFGYVFYNCQTITSGLPALWLTHPDAAHSDAFSFAYLTQWREQGLGCTERRHLDATGADVTFYEHFGEGRCLVENDSNARGVFVPAVERRTMWAAKGTGCTHRVRKGVQTEVTRWGRYGLTCTFRKDVGSDPVYQYQATIARGGRCAHRQTIAGRPQEKAFTRHGGCGNCSWLSRNGLANSFVFPLCPQCDEPFFAISGNGIQLVSGVDWGFNTNAPWCGTAASGMAIRDRLYPTTRQSMSLRNYSAVGGGTRCASCGRTLESMSYILMIPGPVANFAANCRVTLSATPDQFKCGNQRESGLVDCGPTCRMVNTPGTAYRTLCTQSAISLQTECSPACRYVVQQGSEGYWGCRYPNISGMTKECGAGCNYEERPYTPSWVRCSVPDLSKVGSAARCGPECRLLWTSRSPERWICRLSGGGDCVEAKCDHATTRNRADVLAAREHGWARF